MAIVASSLVGCAAITNPVANGIPTRLVPVTLLAESKEDLVEVPLRSLQREPPKAYEIGPGDILAVYVQSVLGEKDQLPPINLPDAATNVQPSVGFPVPVLEDGTLPLPLLDPLPVAGMTVAEARAAVLKAYLDNEIVLPDEQIVLVTLIRPRQVRVLVIREDTEAGTNRGTTAIAPLRGFSQNTIASRTGRGSGDVVELPIYQNDLLTALARTGGLPGADAVSEIVVQRAATRQDSSVPLIAQPATDTLDLDEAITRIPLRLKRGERVPFTKADVTLQEGDIVYVNARRSEVFYTGGLLPAIQVPLPRDEDIDVLEAIALIGGPLVNGGVNGNNLSGGIIGQGLGNPSPKLLTIVRRTPGGEQFHIRVDLERALVDARERILVQRDDFLLLQETPSQAVGRYLSGIFNVNVVGNLFQRQDASGIISVVAP